MVTATDSTVTANSLREKAQPAIAEATRRLVEEFHPEQVWLFGSYAWGEPTPDSDLDFAVVVPASEETPLRRAQRAQMSVFDIPMAADILVPTKPEFERFRHVKASLGYKIVHEGRLLYGSGHD
ncbi:MAG: nucleotidyltransferase domain-containing protein [Prosthecobacter sp.]|uniref:nucleotidyltransferase domain-containing protein n=1 Tax=Prosthecobacter sp. TaxID=1965333 RepID=UPI0039029C98